ncbi:MAG: beta-ketoacyl-ACP synthase, partial [Gammaproteobacteria bacterium]|nr:beta-ketoacyl-ACP synthase [Gammaproteobacteria bacterium]
GREANGKKLQSRSSGLKPCDFSGAEELNTWIGEVDGLEQLDFPAHLSEFDCRNNRLAYLAIMQDGLLESVNNLADAYGPGRVALLMGTSTSGILQTELAYQLRTADDSLPEWYSYQCTHNAYSLVSFLKSLTRVGGPAFSISTACSSSAKVFASAERLLNLGLADAVLVGGVDSLCLTTLYGFNSLQLLSEDPCKPCDTERKGISIGEAAGFALITKKNQSRVDSGQSLVVKGYGESSDAYHMSSPHPEGKGAYLAMAQAIEKASLRPEAVQYINLHGTGTKANDVAEALAVVNLFGGQLMCSSTKGWSGHTLGACGITEIVFSMLSMEGGFLPGTLNLEKIDDRIQANILKNNVSFRQDILIDNVLSNSFGFGGSNCSVLLGRI